MYDGVGAENNSLAIYEMMTQDEIGRYNYLCATSGGDEVERYLKSIRETLNRRLGEKIAGDIKGSTGLQIIYGLNTGADRAANEVASFITGDSTRTAASYAKDIVRQNLYDEGGNTNLFDQMDDIGYTAPGFAATWIAGQLALGLIPPTGAKGENSNSQFTNPYNLKPTHSKKMSNKEFNTLLEDIKTNGIKESIKYVKYDGEMYVVDGHHRLLAAKKLGIKNIPIEEVKLPYKSYKSINDLFWGD